MSAYTIQLIQITNPANIPNPYTDVSIWDSDDPWPIFNESYRTHLQHQIERTYAYYEINGDTIGEFKYRLNARLHLEMPRFNKLYESELLEKDLDPLINFQTVTDETGTRAEDVIGTRNTTTHSERDAETTTNLHTVRGEVGTGRTVTEDEPRGNIGTTTTPNPDYATGVSHTNTNMDIDDDAQGSGTDNWKDDGTNQEQSTSGLDAENQLHREVKGFTGTSKADLLEQYRGVLINIDKMVVESVRDCFLMVYTPNHRPAYGYGTDPRRIPYGNI